MKTIIYFILSILVIFYISCLCALNIVPDIAGSAGEFLNVVVKYGGLVIILAFAAVNFFGNPIKIIFFILLILVSIIYILTLVVPEFFQNLFGAGGSEAFISWISF